MYTYTLTSNGYKIFVDSQLVHDQPFKSGESGYDDYAPGEAQAEAQALVDRKNAELLEVPPPV